MEKISTKGKAMKYPKSRTENNRGAAYLRGREARMASELEKRSEQRIQCKYCEIATRNVVTVLEGYREKEFRGVPCGWSY